MSQTNNNTTTTTTIDITVTSALNNLKSILPQVINVPTETACEMIVKCLLSSFINNDTNISQLLTTLENDCPTLINTFSQINLGTLENLGNSENQAAFINLIIASVMSIANLTSIVESLQLNITSNTICDASFLILVSLLLVILIEKSSGFVTYIQDTNNLNTLFNILSLLETSYDALLSSSELFKEIDLFLENISWDIFNDFDECCKCSFNPFNKSASTTSTTNTTTQAAMKSKQKNKQKNKQKIKSKNQKIAENRIALRIAAFAYTIELANIKGKK